MLITPEVLRDHGACQVYIDFFAKRYPNGIQMSEAIQKTKMPYHAYALHWGYDRLPSTEEQRKAYWEKVQVKESEGISWSHYITNSKLVSHSSYVKNGINIYNSNHIENSENIINSENIEDGKDIVNGKFISRTQKVLNGSNIEESSVIIESTYIINCYGIVHCKNIVDSKIILEGENITSCYFCSKCNNLNNSLFCYRADNDEYLLFNKKIDKMRFTMIAKQFNKYIEDFFTPTNNWEVSFNSTPHLLTNWQKYYAHIPETFWTWVQTLPGYDPYLLYQFTLLPRFL